LKFLISEFKLFLICAPFTAIKFLKTLVCPFETHKSSLTFHQAVLVEAFETDLKQVTKALW